MATRTKLQDVVSQEYGSAFAADADGELLEQFYLLAADEGQYARVVEHAIRAGLGKMRVRELAKLPDEQDRAFVKSLLENAAFGAADQFGALNGRKLPAGTVAEAMIGQIDALLKERKEQHKGGSHGL